MKKQKQGFTKIENDLYEKILETDFTKSQAKILWALLRKLNGFHKEEDRISISQFMEMTNLSNRAVINAQKDLQAMNIASQVEKGISRMKSTKWRINKDISSWRPMKTASLVKKFPLTYELFPPTPMNITSHTKETQKKQKKALSNEERKQKKKKLDRIRKKTYKKMGWSLKK